MNPIDVDFIRSMLRSAGTPALDSFRKVQPSLKENRTYITEADLAVQAHLVRSLQDRYPDDGILAEEEDMRKDPRSGHRYWIIDPIDGTSSFVAGFPVWGLAVGVLEDMELRAGFFYLPVLEDLYYSVKPGAVFRNDEQVYLKPPAPLSGESLMMVNTRPHQSFQVDRNYPGRIKCTGSAVAHTCYVAEGRVDAIVLQGVYIWDIAAGLALLKHNGGILRYHQGKEVSVAELMDGRRVNHPLVGGHPEAVDRFERVVVRIKG